MNALSSQITRAFRHRDFRLLWTGAFLSFIGSWIQTVAQGYLVYKLTGSEAALAFVSLVRSIPYFVMGPLPGLFVDSFNKKNLLIVTQLFLALSSLYLCVANYYGFVQYWQILICALVVGCTGAFEIPARQSAVGSVVPPEDLGAAIPLNALTFNFARLLGPAIGGILLAKVGVDACYLVDGLSYFALVFAALAIHADLRAEKKEPQPIMDLLLEGARYTFREPSLRTLFILEIIVSMCGIFYIALIPAIADKMLNLGTNLGYCYIAMAVGTVSSLLIIAATSENGTRALVLRCDMTLVAAALLALSFTHTRLAAFGLFAVLGFCGVAHFNITNTMFQLLSPYALRGRVLSMHVWALSGIGPFGTMFFGWLAKVTNLATALQAGAACMAIGAIAAWGSKRGLAGI
jgi:MFS family permease